MLKTAACAVVRSGVAAIGAPGAVPDTGPESSLGAVGEGAALGDGTKIANMPPAKPP